MRVLMIINLWLGCLQVQKSHEVRHYNDKGDLFSKFVDEFMRIRSRYSGWPKHCVTPFEKESHLQSIKQNDGIILKTAEIENNPTRRLVAKLMLNFMFFLCEFIQMPSFQSGETISRWGRSAIKSNPTKLVYVDNPSRMSELLFSGQGEIEYITVLDKDTLQV